MVFNTEINKHYFYLQKKFPFMVYFVGQQHIINIRLRLKSFKFIFFRINSHYKQSSFTQRHI